MWLLLLDTSLSLATFVVLLWAVGEYIRARRQIRKLISLLHTKTSRMQMDDLLEGLLAEETAAGGAAVEPAQAAQPDSTTATTAQRERLATIAAGGRPDSTLGRPGPWKKSTRWATTRPGSSTPATRHDRGLP